LIVPLDVDTADEALRVVDRLDGVVSFFKIGLQLFVAGEWRALLAELSRRQCPVFLDLKVPDDIGRTVQSVVEVCVRAGVVRLLTMSRSVTPATVAAARAGRGASAYPKLLVVPYLSSQDARDFEALHGQDASRLDDYIVESGRQALAMGMDGLVVSGQAIASVRRALPETVIVSPGIRPAGAPIDDHKRATTPAEAIRMGSTYLVVGRPIVSASDPREAALRIVDEIGDALRSMN
jgi:orotidine-5'-phosphate decarboxylase